MICETSDYMNRRKENDINIPSWQELSQQNRLPYSIHVPMVRRRLSVIRRRPHFQT